MKKLLTILSLCAAIAIAGCTPDGSENDDVLGGSYDINGAIQKGPFVQGSNITIQPLNKHLKPIGQVYTTQTINDAGLFEMEGVNSKFAEIIAMGYYFDEVEGKVSSAPLTLRSIADLQEGSQTNVNLLTTLTYNRIKNLVANEGKSIADAGQQAERELYTALGIPADMQPSVSCGAMNIANNGEGDGLLLAISAVMQEGRSVGELSEYIAKFSADLADDGRVEQTLLEKFNLDGAHKYSFEKKIKDNLEARYKYLGVECNIPDYAKYLPYLGRVNEHFVISFTYHEGAIYHPDGYEIWGIDDHFVVETDVEYIGHEYSGGYGEIYLSAPPTTFACQCYALRTIEIPDSVTSLSLICCASLESITIPESVTKLEDKAFYECCNLTNITIPDSVTEIGDYAFGNCKSLESVAIGNGVTSIGGGTFRYCSSLASIVIPESVTSIGGNAFEGCSSLASINIPEGVTEIISSTFSGCSSLASITIPESVTEIGYSVFAGCLSLAEFKGKYASDDGRCLIRETELIAFAPYGISDYVVPEEIQVIGNGAFEGCANLVSVTISGVDVSRVGFAAFKGCTSLTSINIPEGVTMIEDETFSGCSSLASIVLPEDTTSIGSSAFLGCSSLASITIPESVAVIGSRAFYGCTSLASINIPDGIDVIDYGVFCGCSSLANIVIPESVTTIGGCAFEDCASLTSITIPEAVVVIESQAFLHCSSLAAIYCKPTIPPTLEQGNLMTITGSMYLEIYVPTESVDAYKRAPGWYTYANQIVGYDFE